MGSSFRTSRPEASSGGAGRRAETLAAEHLIANGLTIIDRNFRTRFGEIDLIARDGVTLVFVEVRMRSSQAYGGGIESISSAKRARLIAAAKGYLATQKREHSRKPDEQYKIIEECSWGPRLEMFSRGTRPGWTVWGNQADESYKPDWPTYNYNSALEIAAE